MFMKIKIIVFFLFIYPLVTSADEFLPDKVISLVEQNKFEQIILLIETSNLDFKKKSVLYFKAGEKFFELKNYETSLLCFVKAENFENKKILNWNKGLCYFGMEQYDEAFDFFKKSIDKNLNESEILIAANSGILSKNYEQALEMLDGKNFALNKEQALNLKSDIYFAVKDYENCLNVQIELLKIKPYDKEYFGNYIKLKKILNKNVKYDIYIQKIIEKDYKFLFGANFDNKFLSLFYYKKLNPENTFEKANLYYNLCLYNQALKEIKKIKNHDFKSGFLNAKILFVKGEYEKSGNIFFELAKHDKKKSGRLYYFAGEAFLMSGKYKKALEVFGLCAQEKSDFSKETFELLNILKGEI